jgi:hypothetical protein
MSLVNGCWFRASAGGTGTFTVSSAITGYMTPATAGAVDAFTYSYRASSDDGTQWEIGIGTYTAAGPTLSRGIIKKSSNSNNAVNFSVAPKVALTYLVEDIVAPISVTILDQDLTAYGSDHFDITIPATLYSQIRIVFTGITASASNLPAWLGYIVTDNSAVTLTSDTQFSDIKYTSMNGEWVINVGSNVFTSTFRTYDANGWVHTSDDSDYGPMVVSGTPNVFKIVTRNNNNTNTNITGGRVTAHGTLRTTNTVVSPTQQPANTVLPFISGTAAVGGVLTCTTGTWTGTTPITYAYQWKSDGANVGTNQNTYTAVSGDTGHAITCVVSATNAGGGPIAATSSNSLNIASIVNTVAPVIALNTGYYGHYAGSKYTATPGTWAGGGSVTGNWTSNGVNIAGATALTYTMTAAVEGTALRYRETNTGQTADSNSLQRPALVNLITNTTSFSTPSVSLPAYRVALTDPTFGTRLVRVTGNVGTQILGMTAGNLWGNKKRARYNTQQAWNCDETLIYLDNNTGGGGYTGAIFLDGQTYLPMYNFPLPSGCIELRWHATNPDKMIYCTDTQIRELTVSTQATTLIRDFAGLYHGITFGGFAGQPSRDGDIWPLAVRKTTNSDHHTAVAYKRSTNAILGEVDIDVLGKPDVNGDGSPGDEVNISPLGNYMYLYFDDETSSVYNINGTLVRNRWDAARTNNPSHYTMTLDGDGSEVTIGTNRAGSYPPGGGRLYKTEFNTDVQTIINTNSFGYHCSQTPITGTFANKWVGTDYWPDSGNPYVNEIVITAIDGTVRGRIGHLHKGTVIDYTFEIQSAMSPTGKRSIFHTPWEATTSTAETHVMVLDWRDFQLPGIG